MPIRIYLDTSVCNRPFDDQQQPRIWLETMALSVILQMVEAGDALLVGSSVVAFETDRNPHPERRAWVRRIAKLAIDIVSVTPLIRQRAIELENLGIAAIDALHIACAEESAVNIFITCDDRLVRRYGRIAVGRLQVTDPVTFARGGIIYRK